MYNMLHVANDLKHRIVIDATRKRYVEFGSNTVNNLLESELTLSINHINAVTRAIKTQLRIYLDSDW